ncbi:MAG TPA: DUF971 domain-containing protein, partial [Rhizobacter sp.]|nr:DUF971 domain-containing protein [Rhizobacter sp.]
VQWEDASATLSATLLRLSCHCTDCRRMAAKGGTVTAATGLQVTGASPVGGYGVQLHFSDGHDRGIYPWSQLRELVAGSATAGCSESAPRGRAT